jgi:hypothetical protein
MAFDLEAFIGANRDFARGYTFYLTISGNRWNVEDDKFLVKTTSLPAGTVGMMETDWQGNKYKLASTQEFENFEVMFNLDVNGADNIRNRFTYWQEQIHNTGSNAHGSPADYMADVFIEHLDHVTGQPITTYKLVGAWPITVSEIQLDYASKEVATFSVSFVYQRHVVNG